MILTTRVIPQSTSMMGSKLGILTRCSRVYSLTKSAYIYFTFPNCSALLDPSAADLISLGVGSLQYAALPMPGALKKAVRLS
jgi:hypothetical protein